MHIGERAPEFQLPSTDGGQWSLAGRLADGGPVALAYFPAAFTGG